MKPDQDAKIDFTAPAILKKCQQGARQRRPRRASYTIIAGTLDECIRKFMSQPVSQHHL
jgi:hypothetical protein